MSSNSQRDLRCRGSCLFSAQPFLALRYEPDSQSGVHYYFRTMKNGFDTGKHGIWGRPCPGLYAPELSSSKEQGNDKDVIKLRRLVGFY